MPLTTNDDSRVKDYYDAVGCDEGDNVKSFAWDNGGICWDNNPFCWDDVALVREILEEVTGGGKVIGTDEGWHDAYEKLDEPKKKRFITLVGKVKGEKDIFKDRKKVKDVQISVSEIKLTVSKVLKIKLDIEKD
jgi:hypothetical protein